MEDASTRNPTCWYVADGTHAAPNAHATATSSNFPPIRLQKRYASLRRRAELALGQARDVANAQISNELQKLLDWDELKPKDEMLALGSRSFRSQNECTIVAKSKVERKVHHAVAQFREEQANERERAALVLRSVRRAVERERERERSKGREKEKGTISDGDEWLQEKEGSGRERNGDRQRGKEKSVEDRDRDFFKRRRTWVEQQALETRKESARLGDELQSGSLNETDSVPVGELIFKVLVYLPRSPVLVSEEFLVLGSTPLTALRDAIYCVMDLNVRNVDDVTRAHDAGGGGTRNDPRANGALDRQLWDDRAYLAVCGQSGKTKFYEDRRKRNKDGNGNENARSTKGKRRTENNSTNDSRANSNVTSEDLSRPIVDSLRDQGRECSVVGMEGVCFSDLGDISFDREVRPMLFGHQHCCEHLVKIVDVRIFNPAMDAPWKQQYPFRVYAPGYVMEHRRMCEVCSVASASQVTYGDKNTPHSPFYWCDQCFGRLHIGEGGNLLYDDFLMYPYTHSYFYR